MDINSIMQKISPQEAYALHKFFDHATAYVRNSGVKYEARFKGSVKEHEILMELVQNADDVLKVEESFSLWLAKRETERETQAIISKYRGTARMLARRAFNGAKVDVSGYADSVQRLFEAELASLQALATR